MQTTLLGLAIALILALLAALIGPHVVDWNQFRGRFEAEATQRLGAPVRIAGPLAARLLPTPSLHLREVSVGGANDPGRLRAGQLDVAFSLGALLRGELRADEVSIKDFALDLGLDAQGRLDWPAAGVSDLAALTVDRLDLTGRIALHHAASRSTVELNDIAFSGELRAQAATLRGDGNFLLNGSRYPFRLSAARAGNGVGTRLRLSASQGAGGLAADLDGVVDVDARVPRFAGTAMLAAAAAPETPAQPPWRLTARLRADPAAAALDQLELAFGTEERAVKLSGAGELRLGASPRLQATLSAGQLDADRLLAQRDEVAADHGWLPRLGDLFAALPPPPLPTRLSIAAEQVMLGGRPVTDVAAELRGEDRSWLIDRLELRAPGGSRLALRGGGGGTAGPPANFNGRIELDSADGELLAAWLQGRPASAGAAPAALRIEGEVSVASDGLVLDPLRIAAAGGALGGRLAYRPRAADRGSRLAARLAGDSIDLDIAFGLARAFTGRDRAWPDEADIALDLGQAKSGDRIWQPLRGRLGYDPHGVVLDQLRIGAADGGMLDGSGRFDRDSATGRLDLQANAPSLLRIAEAIAAVSPALAARLEAVGDRSGPARATLALQLAAARPGGEQVRADAALRLDTPQLEGRVTVTAMLQAADLKRFDLAALSRSDVVVDAALSARRGEPLLALLGLGDVLAAGEGAATLQATATGALHAPLRLQARFSAAGLDAEASGEAEPFAAEPTATLALLARRLDLAPWLDLAGADADAARISGSSRLTIVGRRWTFSEIDAGVAGSRLRGRLALTLGDQIAVDGEAGIDALALGPALQLAIGAAGRDAAAPLGRGLLRGWHGKVALQALRATLPGGSEFQPLGGVLRHDGKVLTLAANGRLGGGDAKAAIAARATDSGVALDVQLAVTGADGPALRFGDLAMPKGRVSLQTTLSSTARSASALAGALAGGGTLTLAKANIAWLDARAFDAAFDAADSGAAIDADGLAKIVEPALSNGEMLVDRAQLALTVADGRVRIAPTMMTAKQARVVVSGGYDIAAGQADLQAALSPTGAGPGLPPEIRIIALGPPDRLRRSVDLSALSAWLALRRIERETNRLQSLEPKGLEAKPQPQQSRSPEGKPQPSRAQDGTAQELKPPESRPPESRTPESRTPESKAPETRVPESKGLEGKTPAGLPGLKPPADGASRTPPAIAVPMPAADPREAVPLPRTQRPLQPPNVPASAAPEKLPPLPPPVDIKPAPGDARSFRPRSPSVLSPANSGATF